MAVEHEAPSDAGVRIDRLDFSAGIPMKPRLALPLCLLFSSAIAAQTSASKPPARCSIEGQIVQQPGGQPVRKADVRLFSVRERQEAEEQEYSAVTDAE